MVTVSIRVMSLGSGYRYLLDSVAVGDGRADASSPLVRYYAESGTPPGYFLGAGLRALDGGRGVEVGSEVTEEHLFNLIGNGADPVSGEPLGRRPHREPKPLSKRVAERIGALGAVSEVEREAARTVIEAEARQRRLARPVAGFDLTMSLPKGASVIWALGDEATRAAVYEAHREAVAIVLSYAEEHVLASRSGRGGIVEEAVEGAIAAAFDHWDSRAGDPHLHTHLVIANRARCVSDGEWRTLDSKRLFSSVVALSELHEGVLQDLLAERLGLRFDARQRQRSAVPRWEVAGIGPELLAAFSSRSTAIAAETQRLVEAFRAAHGRQPSSATVLRLRQQATLSTRGEKQHLSLEQLSASWRERARSLVGDDTEGFVTGLSCRGDEALTALDDRQLDELARQALAAVGERRAVFSAANVSAELHRLLHGRRFSTPQARIATGEEALARALAAAVSLEAPESLHVPAALRRPDGSSRLRPVAARRYTTAELLEAEARLTGAGRRLDAPRLSAVVLDALLSDRVGTLGVDQLLAIEQIAGSGRSVDVLIGPAGSGKTTALRALRQAWEAVNGAGSVIGLAPSAAAAEVLAEGLGISTENTAKWLLEHRRSPGRVELLATLRSELVRRTAAGEDGAGLSARIAGLEQELDRWSLRPGQLLIVDEASLASTRTLDELVAAAGERGAKVLLVGDAHQLSAVEAGGAFAMLAADRDDAPELAEVRRFEAAFEREASLQLRRGDEQAIAAYLANGRIHEAVGEESLDALFTAWREDSLASRRAVMIATDAKSVAELNARARAARLAAGEVSATGVPIASEALAGVGDLVVTRRNDRRLLAGSTWVRNGDEWVVTHTFPDGSLRLRRAACRSSVTLPADYVRRDVELAYAATAHRMQGRTVEIAHALVTAAMTREALYVSATRGRVANHLYVDVTSDADPDTSHGEPGHSGAVEVLARVLKASGADVAASVAMAAERDRAESIATLAAEYQLIAQLAQAPRWRRLLESCGLPDAAIEEIEHSPAYGALGTALRAAEASGLDVERSLPQLVAARSLEDAGDLAAALHGRVTRWVDVAKRRRRTSGAFIAGIVPAARGVADPDLNRALEERAGAMERHADALRRRALEQDERWLRNLVPVPRSAEGRHSWIAAARAVAAYRDRWSIEGDAPFGELAAANQEQAAQLVLVARGIESSNDRKRQAAPGSDLSRMGALDVADSDGIDL